MDRLSKILEACLDTVKGHPAWITDNLGTVIAMNQKASYCNVELINSNETKVNINGKKYNYSYQELNHGTNCFLHELIDEDDLDYKLQQSINALEESLTIHKSMRV
jgi:hypothetical protein